MALFHHDPMRTDAQLDALAATLARSEVAGSTRMFFAREGMEFEL